jgi:hypothetical protein
MLKRIDDDETFLHQICFTDEAPFHMNGCVYQHNCRIWGSEQPNEIHECVHGSAKVSVWCGLLCDRVVGPFFLQRAPLLEAFTRICLKIIFPTNWRLGETGNLVIFKQAGAPHFCRPVHKALNEKFPDSWIGRGGPIFWPLRSPGSYPNGLLLVGIHQENCVWWRFGITAAIATVTPDMIQRIWHEIEYHLDICQATNRVHVEMYKVRTKA